MLVRYTIFHFYDYVYFFDSRTVMPLLLKFQVLLKRLLCFVNSLPRKHFWVLILLFIFLLLISFIPNTSLNDEPSRQQIRRDLVLPKSISLKEEYAIAEPANAGKNNDQLLPDFSGDREVDITIAEGDTLSAIFDQEGLSGAVLQELLQADQEHLRLDNLLPGQKVQLFISPSNQLLSLRVILDLANTLTFILKDDAYVSNLEVKKGEWRNSFYQGSVVGSFSLSANKAGLSPSQIQQVSGALQDKFDFNRQLRAGDIFQVLVAKQYIDGEYNSDSEVLAIMLKTHSVNYTAFLHEDGRYYDKDGKGLTKAYRRLPIDINARISSQFNPRRLHPITGRIAPHNGTDFAVGVGTNVYAIGDGVVVRAGYHPAAGNYIVIKHGRKYTTRFLHLSKLLVRKGQRVVMGDLIAKSGNTGRSTGPHLHYEFHVYGKPVNAMKVNLPLSQEVPKKDKKAFEARRDLFLKQMSAD